MQSSEAVGFLGKSVEDLYGRHVGVVVGFTLKTNGDVESLGVDQGSGAFTELKSTRLQLQDQGVIVVPMWKADVMRITGETEVLRKRISALQELSKDPKEGATASLAQYEQMRGLYETRLAKLQESSDKLLSEMRSRVDELDRQEETFAKFLVNVTIQFRSGEINEESFKVIGDHCGAMKARNVSEREELTAAYEILGHKDGEGRTIELRVPASGATRE